MSITEGRAVNGRKNLARFGAADRIAAFAEATEAYAESLDDPDLANVYWGKSLGLWQAVAILTAEGAVTPAKPRRPVTSCGPRRATPANPAISTRPVGSSTAAASQGC
jgi:hypothetical protein